MVTTGAKRPAKLQSDRRILVSVVKLGDQAVVKVRGQGAQPPCSDLSPLQQYDTLLIESIKCYFMPK